MPRASTSLFARDRIDPHPKVKSNKHGKGRKEEEEVQQQVQVQVHDHKASAVKNGAKPQQKIAAQAPRQAMKASAQMKRGVRTGTSSRKEDDDDDVDEEDDAMADGDGNYDDEHGDGDDVGDIDVDEDDDDNDDDDDDDDDDGLEGIEGDEEGSWHEEDSEDATGNSGVGATAEDGPAHVRKGSKLRSVKEIYAAPSHDELATLKQTETLFKSNLFRMQLEEMLKEVRVEYDNESDLDDALRQLRECIDSIRPMETQVTPETQFKGVHVPISIRTGTANMTFKFVKPSKVHVVGSYLLHTVAKPELNVDMFVEMPVECFQARDYLNHRFVHKRAYYLAKIAAALRARPQFANLSFAHFQGNFMRPVLLVRPDRSRFVVRIHVGLPDSVFKLTRLGPEQNALRHGKNEEILSLCDIPPEVLKEEIPTPHYNNEVVVDILMPHHLRLIHECANDCGANFRDAVLLLKTWCRQRGFTNHKHGTLNGFLATMVLVHLVQTRAISKHSSSYQFFRAVLIFLSKEDLRTVGVAMKQQTLSDAFPAPSELPSLQAFKAAFDVAFIDPSGFCNLFGAISKNAFAEIRQEAATAIAILDNPVVDEFHSLFMEKLSFEEKYDVVIRVPATAQMGKRYPRQILDRGGDWVAFANALIVAVVSQGLGDRAALVVARSRECEEWDVTSEAKEMGEFGRVVVGVQLNSHVATRLVDTGPPADAPEAAAFRNFWGSKSELRRFQDGSICEAVVWECPAAREHLVVNRIVQYVLGRHADIAAGEIAMVHNPLELLLVPGARAADSGMSDQHEAIKATTELSSALRRLNGLPLQIVSLLTVSSCGSYTDPFPPRNAAAPLAEGEERAAWRPAIHLQLQLESSGKWPDDFEAIQQIKTAFYVKLATLLREQQSVSAVPTESFMDIQFCGFDFRLSLYVEREHLLAKQRTQRLHAAVKALEASGTPDAKLTLASDLAEATAVRVRRANVLQPLHVSLMHTLHGRFPAFGPTARLAKRWVAAHMFSGHLSEQAVELLVASLFLSPFPYAVPGAPHVGLLRFLRLISHHDWLHEPLLVDVQGVWTTADITRIVDDFHEKRSSLPAIFIASNKDETESLWTSEFPSKQILLRLVIFARESEKVVRQFLLRDEPSDEELGIIFHTPLSDYNALIRLQKSAVPRYAECVQFSPQEKTHAGSQFKNLALARKKPHTTRVHFDAVELYLRDLRAAYGHSCMFFYDAYGGDVIGVVFDPQARAPHPFKIPTCQDRAPYVPPVPAGGGGKRRKSLPAAAADSAAAEDLVVLGTDAVLCGFRVLGQGLVEEVVNQMPQ